MRKIKNLDKLLKADNINSSIIDLDNFICEVCKDGDKMDKLSDPQKHFYLNQTLEREINNGGFDQYFCNSGKDNAYETIASLNSIGAKKTADILQRAISLVLQLIEKAEEVSEEVWNDLDKEFLKYEDDLNFLNIQYVKHNKDFF